MNIKSIVFSTLAAAVLLAAVCLGGCAGNVQDASSSASDVPSDSPSSSSPTAPLSVAAMKGPTAIGLAWEVQRQQDQDDHAWDFTVAASADELVPRIAAGDFDIALVPANVAANLYHQTDGAVRAIGINTLGVLYGLARDGAIDSMDDLAGRTVYLTGKGSVPEYTVDYLLEQAGVADQVTLEFTAEPAEALARLQADSDAVVIVPEPFATTALAKDETLRRVLDLTALWDQATVESADDGRLVTGVTVARADLLQEDPAAAAAFLQAQGESVEQALADPAAVAATLVDWGILGSEGLAESAVPRCNIVCVTAESMKQDLEGYLSTLAAQAPASIGGQMPDQDFYYLG